MQGDWDFVSGSLASHDPMVRCRTATVIHLLSSTHTHIPTTLRLDDSAARTPFHCVSEGRARHRDTVRLLVHAHAFMLRIKGQNQALGLMEYLTQLILASDFRVG